MNKVLLAGLTTILIGVMSMSMSAVAGPSHYNAEEIARYEQLQRYKAQGWN
tara:strand:+ start:616 stop:768 length:153 start_codon:yes stop_codon:yes gene_type:complete